MYLDSNFFRHRLPYTVLSRSIVVINALIGLTGIAQFGLTSAGIGFLIIMGPAAAIFCGRREGIAVLIFVVFASILVAVSFVGGTLTYPMDVEAYLLSPSAWACSDFRLVHFLGDAYCGLGHI